MGYRPHEAGKRDRHHNMMCCIGMAIFRYLGHTIAHPLLAQKARDKVLAKVESDLTQYSALPLNAFERVKLLNFPLIPRWLYHTMFIPHDGVLPREK